METKELTIEGLQKYIRRFDHRPEHRQAYFMKLVEEVGELSEVIRKNARMKDNDTIKGTIEEELSDVLYYVVALANVYDINLTDSFWMKDELNKIKWSRQEYEYAVNQAKGE
ncbi:MazG nucleotide pyrophosphohydrolase domain-containing protein [Paenibacillus sp. J2TS4]|uniref:MazG nucleotide pyrophosphohydrolase domain-containing protein n=1 Tax=Paenibacillus sp. J2TS4 TaxID=2807194 RepID=UPI001B182DB2|nr:MazG nucleotide pyrophosphohydrolase domain-containing protein [Paenibacillus sp. J2TS4]GIP34029.1 nucleotide pyrophosphohydrolase [Paenibacillus sp. J2TS4]